MGRLVAWSGRRAGWRWLAAQARVRAAHRGCVQLSLARGRLAWSVVRPLGLGDGPLVHHPR
jgi:hypothetical protein